MENPRVKVVRMGERDRKALMDAMRALNVAMSENRVVKAMQREALASVLCLQNMVEQYDFADEA